MLTKQWVLAEPASSSVLRGYAGMNAVIAQVLYNRGFHDPQDAARFLYAKEMPFDPFELDDMSRAVSRIRDAIQHGEKVVVYGDFDADGVTSTALLVTALYKLGANVSPYIPHRVEEGYGLNAEALQEIARQGAKLVITVDCGIRSVQEVEDGKAAGLDIIVTDHHSLGPEMPDAYAVVNPKRAESNPWMLAGVGVAYSLAYALYRTEQDDKRRSNGHYKGRRGHSFNPRDVLDLVAIGTVADLMPLNRIENRVLVRRGLQMINRADRPGVRALMEVCEIEPGKADAQSIGFGLGPRINAAGRLDSAMIAYHLLTMRDFERAREIADQLQELNTRRQEITRNAQATIRDQLAERDDDDIPLIFASDPSFEPGIVGLVAGRLTEEYFRPAVIMEEGEDESRASCRSIPQFDITSALDQCADLLVRHGGHSLAAGFTVANENIPALRERLIDLATETLIGQELSPTLHIDAEVDLHQLSEGLVDELNALEPTGHNNAPPVFMTRNVHVAERRTVGREDKHLKLKISRASRPPLDCIGFNLGHWVQDMPDRIDMAFYLEINEWNGRKSLQCNLRDIRPAEGV